MIIPASVIHALASLSIGALNCSSSVADLLQTDAPRSARCWIGGWRSTTQEERQCPPALNCEPTRSRHARRVYGGCSCAPRGRRGAACALPLAGGRPRGRVRIRPSSVSGCRRPSRPATRRARTAAAAASRLHRLLRRHRHPRRQATAATRAAASSSSTSTRTSRVECWGYPAGETARSARSNDRASSVWVADGYVATLFLHASFDGAAYNTVTASDPWSWTDIGNDNVSSLVVQRADPDRTYYEGTGETQASDAQNLTSLPASGCSRRRRRRIVHRNFSGRRLWRFAYLASFCWNGATITALWARDPSARSTRSPSRSPSSRAGTTAQVAEQGEAATPPRSSASTGRSTSAASGTGASRASSRSFGSSCPRTVWRTAPRALATRLRVRAR